MKEEGKKYEVRKDKFKKEEGQKRSLQMGWRKKKKGRDEKDRRKNKNRLEG